MPITTITGVEQNIKGGYAELLEALRAAFREDEMRDKPYPTGETYLDAYTWTLFEGMFKERHRYPTFPTTAELQEHAFRPSGKDPVSDWFKSVFNITVRTSCVFKTSTGHLGTTGEAQPGTLH